MSTGATGVGGAPATDGPGAPSVPATPVARTEARMEIRGEDDIVAARQRARDTARRLGFGMVDQSRIATAVSELTRNVVRYATNGRGEMILRQVLRQVPGPAAGGLEIVVSDQGPGIADLEQAMREGYTSGNGLLGVGLPGTKRLMDEMDIQSTPEQGTAITIRKWRR